jgi:hypothetical protein
MSKKAFHWVLLGYVILAVGFGIVAGLVVSEIHRLDATQKNLRALACQLDRHVNADERVMPPDDLCHR